MYAGMRLPYTIGLFSAGARVTMGGMAGGRR